MQENCRELDSGVVIYSCRVFRYKIIHKSLLFLTSRHGRAAETQKEATFWHQEAWILYLWVYPINCV